jgi:hypothetical protein
MARDRSSDTARTNRNLEHQPKIIKLAKEGESS